MRVLVWAAELARAFWAEVGADEPFPRKLRDPIRAMPLTLEAIPILTAAAACDWLERNGITHGFSGRDRPLRGCLTASGGHGIIFLDAADPEDEQRFTLAHEVAHFLRDYWRPRRRALRHLGEEVSEVLDGKRAPTLKERVAALLTEVPLHFHMHLMDRDEQQAPINWDSADAEACADRLAYELLAPAEHVIATCACIDGHTALEHRLVDTYGLPAAQAYRYARQLTGARPPAEPWLAALTKSLKVGRTA